MGDKSCLSFYGRHPALHQLIAEHLTAEYRVKTIGRGRTVDEWKLRPERNDNHWLDCMSGCAVCASMLGSTLPEFGAVKKRTAMTGRLSDMQKGRRESYSVPQTQESSVKLSDLQKNRKKH